MYDFLIERVMEPNQNYSHSTLFQNSFSLFLFQNYFFFLNVGAFIVKYSYINHLTRFLTKQKCHIKPAIGFKLIVTYTRRTADNMRELFIFVI